MMGRKITLEEIKNGWVMIDSTTREKVFYPKPRAMVEELGMMLREKQTELST